MSELTSASAHDSESLCVFFPTPHKDPTSNDGDADITSDGVLFKVYQARLRPGDSIVDRFLWKSLRLP